MKKLAIWSTLLLLLLCIPSCHPRQQPQSEPEGDTTPIYNLPIVDYDFAGSVDDIVAFEKALGHTLDKSQSNATTLTFSTGQKDFSETVYHLENRRIMEIYQPCSSGDVVKKILPQLAKELKQRGWSEWTTPVRDGQCDAAFLLLGEVNGTQAQIGSVVVHTRTNNVKKTYPSITFIFSRIANNIDPKDVTLPDLYLDGLGKTREEIKKYYTDKGFESTNSASFLRIKVDNPAYRNEVLFFFQDGNPKCHSIIIAAVNFRINKSDNLTNQLKKLGFEYDSEESGAISKFLNEEKGIWAFIRFRPLSQFDQPNLTFTKQPKNF